MSRWHKVTSPDEFRRRTDALRGLDLPGRLVLQAAGAWLQLWVGHSWADGTVPLTPAGAAGIVGASPRSWRELADVLAAAGLLERDGEHYRVPDPEALEGFALEHRGPAGFRSLHRAAFHEQAVLRVALHAGHGHAAGGRRRALLGVLAWVLLRHTSPRGTRVSAQARPELDELLDRDTARAYLAALDGLLARNSRGRLAYVGRSALEGSGRPDTLSAAPSPRATPSRPAAGQPQGAVAEAGGEPSCRSSPTPAGADGSHLDTAAGEVPRVDERHVAPAAGTETGTEKAENPHAGASSRSTDQELQPSPDPRQATPAGRCPGTAEVLRHPMLEQLLQALVAAEPRLNTLQTSRRRRGLLAAALHAVDGRAAELARALTARELGTAEHPAAVLTHRLPAAVDELTAERRRRDVEQARCKHQTERAHQWVERAEQRRLVDQAHDDRERDAQALRAVAGDGYAAALEQAGAALLGPVRSSGAAAERTVLAAVRRRAAAACGGEGSPVPDVTGRLDQLPAGLLHDVLLEVVADPAGALAA